MTMMPQPPQASWYEQGGHHHDAAFDNRDPDNDHALAEFEKTHPRFFRRLTARLRRQR
jgi:hypothetical protein